MVLSWIRVSDGTSYYAGELRGNWALSCDPTKILYSDVPSFVLPLASEQAFLCPSEPVLPAPTPPPPTPTPPTPAPPFPTPKTKFKVGDTILFRDNIIEIISIKPPLQGIEWLYGIHIAATGQRFDFPILVIDAEATLYIAPTPPPPTPTPPAPTPKFEVGDTILFRDNIIEIISIKPPLQGIEWLYGIYIEATGQRFDFPILVIDAEAILYIAPTLPAPVFDPAPAPPIYDDLCDLPSFAPRPECMYRKLPDDISPRPDDMSPKSTGFTGLVLLGIALAALFFFKSKR